MSVNALVPLLLFVHVRGSRYLLLPLCIFYHKYTFLSASIQLNRALDMVWICFVFLLQSLFDASVWCPVKETSPADTGGAGKRKIPSDLHTTGTACWRNLFFVFRVCLPPVPIDKQLGSLFWLLNRAGVKRSQWSWQSECLSEHTLDTVSPMICTEHKSTQAGSPLDGC